MSAANNPSDAFLKGPFDPHAGPRPGWHGMDTAPKDRQIIVRRHNDVMYEYDIVQWRPNNEPYPWCADYTAYPEGRLDEWHEIPQ